MTRSPVLVVQHSAPPRGRSPTGEEEEHCSYASVPADLCGQAEFHEDGADMLIDGAFGDHQTLGDLPVRQAFAHQRQYL